MIISNIADLQPAKEAAIIINAETKYVTTLALLSALRHVRVPTLVIDCDSRDGSFTWFENLMKHYDFELMSASLRPHGETLDWILRGIPADRVLLVDSDVEVLNETMLTQMRAMLETNGELYGSGFLQPGHWLRRHYFTGLDLESGIGYYAERPWIPFALLNVRSVRHALSQGATFMHELVLNDFAKSRFLSRLMWHRFRLDLFRRHRLRFLDPLRGRFNGQRPSYISFDTGARLHQSLFETQHLKFGDVGADIVPWSVTHFSGVTRRMTNPKASDDASNSDAVHRIVVERLRTQYHMTI